MVWEVLRLGVSFVCFLGAGRMFRWGARAGIDPLTVWYINFSL